MTSSSTSGPTRAEIGVIGGSGFYEFLDDAERVSVATPFGDPSDDLFIGELHGRRVAFIARHGKGHRFPPHRVNYRANLWALRSVGVRQVLAPCAVGSLSPGKTSLTLVGRMPVNSSVASAVSPSGLSVVPAMVSALKSTAATSFISGTA